MKEGFFFCTALCFLWNPEVELPFKRATRVVHYRDCCCSEWEIQFDEQAAMFQKGSRSACIFATMV